MESSTVKELSETDDTAAGEQVAGISSEIVNSKDANAMESSTIKGPVESDGTTGKQTASVGSEVANNGDANTTTMESTIINNPAEIVSIGQDQAASAGSEIANSKENDTPTTMDVKLAPEKTRDTATNNEDDNDTTSSSSSIEVYVPSSLDYLQSRKRIPFLKRNLIAMQQRQVGLSSSQEDDSSTMSYFLASVLQGAPDPKELQSHELQLPFKTYLSVQQEKESMSKYETQMLQPQQASSLTSTPLPKRTSPRAATSPSTPLSKRTRGKASSSPQSPAVAPWMHQDTCTYEDIKKQDEKDQCRIICFTTIFTHIPKQKECHPVANQGQRSNIRFVEDSLLVALQLHKQIPCPFCSHHLPPSVLAMVKHCKRFHGDHHKFTVVDNLKHELNEGMVHIIAKPIGYPNIDLDFVRLRSFCKLPRRWGETESESDDESTTAISSKESSSSSLNLQQPIEKRRRLNEEPDESKRGEQHVHSEGDMARIEQREREPDHHLPPSPQEQQKQQQREREDQEEPQQRDRMQIQRKQKQRFTPLIPKVLLKEKYDIHSQGLTLSPSSSSTTLAQKFVPNRQYYHSMSRIPMSQDEWEVDSDDLSEDEWRDEFNAACLSEFEDVTEKEKEFLDLWNRFVHRNSTIYDYEMPVICLVFVRCFATSSIRRLREQLVLHLMMLWEKQQISSDHIDDCLKEYDALVEVAPKGDDDDDYSSIQGGKSMHYDALLGLAPISDSANKDRMMQGATRNNDTLVEAEPSSDNGIDVRKTQGVKSRNGDAVPPRSTSSTPSMLSDVITGGNDKSRTSSSNAAVVNKSSETTSEVALGDVAATTPTVAAAGDETKAEIRKHLEKFDKQKLAATVGGCVPTAPPPVAGAVQDDAAGSTPMTPPTTALKGFEAPPVKMRLDHIAPDDLGAASGMPAMRSKENTSSSIAGAPIDSTAGPGVGPEVGDTDVGPGVIESNNVGKTCESSVDSRDRAENTTIKPTGDQKQWQNLLFNYEDAVP